MENFSGWLHSSVTASGVGGCQPWNWPNLDTSSLFIGQGEWRLLLLWLLSFFLPKAKVWFGHWGARKRKKSKPEHLAFLQNPHSLIILFSAANYRPGKGWGGRYSFVLANPSKSLSPLSCLGLRPSSRIPFTPFWLGLYATPAPHSLFVKNTWYPILLTAPASAYVLRSDRQWSYAQII